MQSIKLAYPPSTNRLTRTGNGRAYASPKATAWKKQSAIIARASGARPSSLPMEVAIRLHPRVIKGGAASKTRIDIDNAIKAALDALNGVAWYDDKQVVKIQAEVAEAMPDGGLTVTWEEVSA